MRVSAPVSKDEIGTLVMVDDGAWYFLSNNALPAPNGLVRFRDGLSGEWHDFAVKARFDWGTQLGRLDNRPLSSGFSGTPGPVPGLCQDLACVDAAPAGTWFNVYARGSDGLTWSGRVPQRVGRLRSNDPTSAVWQVAVQDWVALPDTVGPPRPNGSVGLVKCSPTSSVASVAVAEPGDDPLAIEAAAFEHGVDAFVTCEDGGFKVRIPSALRAPLPSLDLRLRTQPVVTGRPVRVSGDLEEVARWAVSLGLGDFESAVLLQPAIVGRDTHLALETAEIASAVGRHEEALARAWDATASVWNREADFFWVFLRARVASELRNEAAFSESWARLPDMVRRLEDTRVFAWFVWQVFKTEASDAPAANYAEADKMLASDGHMPYRTLLRLSRAVLSNDEAARTHVQSKLGDSALAASLDGRVVGLETSGPLDVYGRRWATKPGGDLTRVGFSSYRPGFAVHRPESALDQVYWASLVGRPMSPSDVTASVDCDAKAFALESGLDLDPGASWALTAGRQAACQGMAALLASADAGTPETRAARRDFVVGWAQHILTREVGFEALEQAAAWASKETTGQTCRLWNLSVGYSALQAERVDLVETALAQANRCADTSWRISEKRLAAALQWMVSGRVAADFERDVVLAVRQATGQDVQGCALAGPMDVRLQTLAEPEVAAMIRQAPAAMRTDGELALVTSPGRLRAAFAALDGVREAVRAHDATGAAKGLAVAREHFGAVGHVPGLRLVRLLELALFQTDVVDETAVTRAARSRDAIWKGQWAEASQPTTKLAMAFFRGDWAKVPVLASELPGELCAMPVAQERGPNIDLDAL